MARANASHACPERLLAADGTAETHRFDAAGLTRRSPQGYGARVRLHHTITEIPDMPNSRSTVACRGFLPCMAFALVACTPPPASTDPSRLDVGRELTPEMLLEELNPRGGADVIRAWNGSEPEAVADFYTEDAVLVVDERTVYRGRAEILNGWLRPLVPAVSDLTPTLEQVIGGPNRMTLIGTYTARFTPPDGPAFQAGGIFGNTWVRQSDGFWKIKASINSAPTPRD